MSHQVISGVISSDTLDNIKVKRQKFFDSVSDMKSRYISYFDELDKNNLQYIIPTFSEIAYHNDGQVSIEVTVNFDSNLRQDIFDDYYNSVLSLWTLFK